jgi:hypothetical protein
MEIYMNNKKECFNDVIIKNKFSKNFSICFIFLIGFILGTCKVYSDNLDSHIRDYKLITELNTDKHEYTDGDVIEVNLTIDNFGDKKVVDIYFALKNPDNVLLFLPDWTEVPRPAFSGFVIDAGFYIEYARIFNYPVPSQKPPIEKSGYYTFAIGITEKGTSEFYGGLGSGLNSANFKVQFSEGCPQSMVKIPQFGRNITFTMGDSWVDGDIDEQPSSQVDLNVYCIDKYEYPNIEGEYPYNYTDWYDASALCLSQSKRLCTESEWENSCKGPSGYKYPYGNDFRSGYCNSGPANEPERSGSRQNCVSGYGVYDMSGNMREWVNDWYISYTNADLKFDFNGYYRVLRGGDYESGYLEARCSNRSSSMPSRISKSISWRCCK